jgi:ribosomal protein L12E/L44/L45/RPP1/RPP2
MKEKEKIMKEIITIQVADAVAVAGAIMAKEDAEDAEEAEEDAAEEDEEDAAKEETTIVSI